MNRVENCHVSWHRPALCSYKSTATSLFTLASYSGVAPKIEPGVFDTGYGRQARGGFFGSEGLYAYDADGKLLWKQDLGVLNAGFFFDPDYEWGVGSSPIIYRNLVIVQCDIQKDSFVAAYDISDGHRIWMTPRQEIPSWGTPTIYEGEPRTELITQATKFTRAYEPTTGKELWKLSGNSEITTPTPIVAHKLIFVTNGYRGIMPIYAIRRE